jgi:hypothetical protein
MMGVFGFLFKYSWVVLLIGINFFTLYWAGYVPQLPQMQPLIDNECCLGICKHISKWNDCYTWSNLNRTVTCSPYDLKNMQSIPITNVSNQCFIYWNKTANPFKSFPRQGIYVEFNNEENLSLS